MEVYAGAYQFARHNQYIADLAPLQLYASALVFASDLSIIKTLFKPCMPLWLLNPPKIERSWHSERLKFEGHASHVHAIKFSPNDEFLGTHSSDGTARVWDTTDASCLLTVSHDDRSYQPYAIAFSSDSSKIAVAYTNVPKERPAKIAVTIYTRTGALLRTMQCLGSFASDLRLAVSFVDDSGQDDDAITLAVATLTHVQAWRSVKDSDILMRAWTCQCPYQEGQYPINVCISQDASLLCCSGVLDERDDGESSISTLNLKTGSVTSRHVRHEDFGNMVFCGTTLVCQMRRKEHEPGRLRMSLRTFDFGNPGESTHLLDYDDFWHKFSLANAKHRVAFNTISNYTVHIETIPISKRVGEPMQGPHERRVAVAPRGDLVADWNDGHLIIFDTQGLVTQIFDGQESFKLTQCLIISPDSRFIALGHEKGVTVWNLETGKRSQYSEIKDLFALAFSNDNETLACASNTNISIWDLESKQMMLTTQVYGGCRRLKFSTDGDYLITDRRRLHIATATWTTLNQMDPSMSDKEVILSGGFSSLGWVRLAEEDLLWIPVEYRANYEKSDARGGTVALCQEDGSVMILTFDLSVL